jgi:UDP-GlcNAc:undecaprenyl-phosphate GlcNAc-1-phosphate transferase
MVTYLIAFSFLTPLMLAYFKLADHFNIIDKPNARSSHSSITIRGGGIIFPIAVLLWVMVFGFKVPLVLGALLLLSIISFMDDVMTLSSNVRIVVHFLAVGMLFWHTGLFELPWYGIAIAVVVTMAWINGFNFMDGINGITAFYGLVALATFGLLNLIIGFTSTPLIIVLLFAVLLFAVFNARKKAVAFAGDVGSVSMAFILAWLMIALMQTTGRLEYIMLFSVYGIDTALTIAYRLKRGENIFEAHRSHLYQYLSNELGWPHLSVSALYALIQASVNVITISLIRQGWMSWSIFSAFLIIQVVVYLWARYRTLKRIEAMEQAIV